jgi:hypothetical protein
VAVVIDQRVMSNAIDPGFDARRFAQCAAAPESFEQRLLRQILHQGGIRNPPAKICRETCR